MPLEYQILAAFVLDLLLGDPRWLPHPVRGIAFVARMLERVTRRVFTAGPAGEKFAGILTALGTYAIAGGAVWGLMRLAGLVHPLAADAVGIVAMYTTIAARDLARHGMAVYRPMVKGDIS